MCAVVPPNTALCLRRSTYPQLLLQVVHLGLELLHLSTAVDTETPAHVGYTSVCEPVDDG